MWCLEHMHVVHDGQQLFSRDVSWDFLQFLAPEVGPQASSDALVKHFALEVFQDGKQFDAPFARLFEHLDDYGADDVVEYVLAEVELSAAAIQGLQDPNSRERVAFDQQNERVERHHVVLRVQLQVQQLSG